MNKEIKNKRLQLAQFWLSFSALLLYLIVPFLDALHVSVELSVFQIAIGLLAVFLGGGAFIKEFNKDNKNFCCPAFIYLLIMAVCVTLTFFAYQPILQDATVDGVVPLAAMLTHWVNVLSVVAFLSIFVVTAAESGFIQDKLKKE